MRQLEIFTKRLNKIGVEVEYSINYPWIYLDKINGKKVKEKFYADHGFTLAFIPIGKHIPFSFSNIKEIFRLIRKYLG